MKLLLDTHAFLWMSLDDQAHAANRPLSKPGAKDGI